MSSQFPTALPSAKTDYDNTDNIASADPNALGEDVNALGLKVGIDSSADATSIDYLLKNTSSSNPGHKHTLANSATDVTASAAELNYVDGVTSAIQTQLGTKAPLASPTFTGTVTLPVGLTGVVRTDTGVVSVDGDVTDIVTAATTSAAGKVEIAIASEVNTGTDATRAISPDALAGSNFGIRYVAIPVFGTTTNTATGDGKAFFHIPPALNGMNLVYAHGAVYTAGTTNSTTVQIYNLTQTVDMLTALIEIETGEVGSDTSDPGVTIDTDNDNVTTNDRIRIDVDSISTTPAVGLVVTLGFALA